MAVHHAWQGIALERHTFCLAGHLALSASSHPLRFEGITSSFRAYWNPVHFSTGCVGYFGNR